MNPPKRPLRLGAAGVVAIYVVLAALWILFSDRAVAVLFSDSSDIVVASMLKGWLFVAITAALLYGLMRRMLAEAQSGLRRELLLEREKLKTQMALQTAQKVALEAESEARREAAALVEEAVAARDLAQQAGVALQQSEARFQLALDATNDGLWDWDFDTQSIFLSLHYCEIFGLPPGTGGPDIGFLQKLVDPADWSPLMAAIERARRSDGDFGECEFRIVTAAGVRKWIHGKGRVVEHDATGKPRRMIGTVSDITRRKLAEDEFYKLSQAVEQSPEAVEITDLEARIEYVNAAFLRTTGYTREELIGKTPRILKSGKTPLPTYVEMWTTLSRGETWKGEFINRRKDGSEFVEFAIVSPLRRTDGTITHYVAVKEDVTEKKRIGAELDSHRYHLQELVEQRTAELHVARQQADAANLAKSAFLANMSHEIRTPLNAILGLTYLLRRSGVGPSQTERLDKIDGAGRHLLAIINDILDLSKIEAGHVELESIDFHLPGLLESVASIVREAATQKGLELLPDIDAMPEWLRGDPTRLRQGLLNFAANAVKFTERGSVILRSRLLTQDADGTLVRFEVVDTGPGIEPTVAARLFQPFEQGDVATRRRHGGTGLGLAITRRLASMMGGESGVDSVPGEGSVFWFTARLLRAAPPRAPAPVDGEACDEATLRARLLPGRVLLAEDNLLNQEIAVEMLRWLGLEVDAVEDGREALRKVQEANYDLVLMDMQMPAMTGVEATRAIRELPAGRRLPIIAMTANAFEEDRRACMEAGMDDFLVKPVEPARLCELLMKWLPQGKRQTAD